MNVMRLQLLFRKANETADVAYLLSSLGPWEAFSAERAGKWSVSRCRFWMLVHHSFQQLQVGSFSPSPSFSCLGSCAFSMTADPGQFACRTDDKRHSACQSRWRSVTVRTRRCLLTLWPRDLTACLLSQRRGRWGRNKFDTNTIIPHHHPSFHLSLFLSVVWASPSSLFWREITMLEGSPSWRPSTSVETNWTTRSHWQFVRLCLFRNGCARQGLARRWQTVSVWVNTENTDDG